MAFPTDPQPNHIEEKGRKFLVDEVKAEDGSVYTRLRNTAVQRTWTLEYTQLDETGQTTMNNWYEGVYGAFQADTWTHPYLNTTVNVRCREFRWKVGAYPRRNLSVTLEEVL